MNYCNPEGFRKELRSLVMDGTKDDFFTWFDGGEDTDGAFEKAQDVFLRLFFPYAKAYLGDLKEKISLDIGYGSGGQVLEASHHFKKAKGIDVHLDFGYVSEELIDRGAQHDDFELVTSNGHTIPFEDRTIDFIHSWVTFLHFSTLDMVMGYFAEINRVLVPGGVGVIFFSRLMRSQRPQTWNQVQADMVREEGNSLGYREGGPKSKVKSISIVMSMWKMEEIVKSFGLNVMEKTASWSKEDGKKVFHGQYGIVFQKPPEVKQRKRSKRIKKTL